MFEQQASEVRHPAQEGHQSRKRHLLGYVCNGGGQRKPKIRGEGMDLMDPGARPLDLTLLFFGADLLILKQRKSARTGFHPPAGKQSWLCKVVSVHCGEAGLGSCVRFPPLLAEIAP